MLSFTRDKPGISLQPYIDNICQSSGIGLELVTTSFLPQGSGMGSSSILAGCMLVSLSKCLGLSFDDEDDDDYSDGLTRAVLLLEQLLSTGGGWQDQVGGLHGGLKLGLSERNRVPIRVEVKQINIQDEIIAELNERMVLIYTGQPRLARNILRNVLRRWVSRRQEIMNTINNLVEEANEVAKALNNGDIDSIGPLLRQYWSNKKTMAGPESGVEPLIVGEIIDILHERDVIIGATLCGAGGGGFLFVLTKGGMSKNDVKECINQNTQKFKSCVGSISFYDCKVCLDGVNISTTATDDIFEVPQSPPKNP
jgi:fucokinase